MKLHVDDIGGEDTFRWRLEDAGTGEQIHGAYYADDDEGIYEACTQDQPDGTRLDASSEWHQPGEVLAEIPGNLAARRLRHQIRLRAVGATF